jgi:DNA repair protein RadD
MLTHQKELIEQNAEKLRALWPDAPLGIYSASIGRRQLDQITFAGIQSVRSRAKDIGHVDLAIIDECHLVSHANVGSYRRLLDDLLAINPALRVIGLTATPYRLGHGLITDAPALFDDLIEPTDVRELIKSGYLAPLKSKHTELTYDTAGIHKRGGDFIESELSERVNTTAQNVSVVEEIILRGRERKTWLIFCAGVDHAYAVSEQIRACGINCDTVTGETSKADRERMLEEFKAGRLRALTNANCLTTGVDVPGIDLVAMLRPTASPGLYVQMAGRGLRIAPGKTDCLILDFAGVVATHGPLTDVQMPQPGKPTGEAPVKACPECAELIHLSYTVCPECGYEFPQRDRTRWLKLHADDILGTSERRMDVARWIWRRHVSRASGAAMLRVTYYARAISDEPLTEYYPVMHDGYAGRKAREELARILWNTKPEGLHLDRFDLDVISRALNDARPPRRLFYKRDGKFNRVHRREW